MSRSSLPRWLTLGLVLVAGATLLSAAAREPANDFQFSVLGDRTGGHHPGVFERVWREVGLLNPDFAINVGDTIEGYIRDPAQIEAVANAQWDEIEATTDQYKDVPLYYTVGNHDIWDDISERIYKERTGFAVDYSFRYQQALFVVLDNSRVNELTDAQYQFLEEALTKAPDARPKFVFFHKPFWIGYVAAQNKDHRLHQIAKRFGVDWVITGHGHTLVHEKFDGVSYLEVGSSGGGIGLLEDGTPNYQFEKGKFFHHVLARVRGGTVEMTVKEIQGGGGQGRVFSLDSWRGSSPLFTDTADPAVGEQMLGSMRFQTPLDGATVTRGVIPIVAAARARQQAVELLIDDVAVTPTPGPFAAAVFDVRDLHSRQLQSTLLVNGELVTRLSPDRDIVPWETMIVPVSRDLWLRKTPGEVTLTAGTATDASGANLPENNDDYFVRDLLIYDGNGFVGPADLPVGQEIKLGDTAETDQTVRTWQLAEARTPDGLALLLHAWDTGNLPAGPHTLELRFAGRAHKITVTVP